jgi:hypothetical protein
VRISELPIRGSALGPGTLSRARVNLRRGRTTFWSTTSTKHTRLRHNSPGHTTEVGTTAANAMPSTILDHLLAAVFAATRTYRAALPLTPPPRIQPMCAECSPPACKLDALTHHTTHHHFCLCWMVHARKYFRLSCCHWCRRMWFRKSSTAMKVNNIYMHKGKVKLKIAPNFR